MQYSYNDFETDIRMGREIEFLYNSIKYFATYDDRGTVLIKVDDGTKQIFKNDDEFLSNALIESKKIYQIWDEIIVDTIY